MAFGGAGCTAAAVPACAAAQQNHLVAGSGTFPAHIFLRNGSNYGANFHPLGRIARVVNFIHQAGSQTDLIAIGGITCGRCSHQLPLGQLAR